MRATRCALHHRPVDVDRVNLVRVEQVEDEFGAQPAATSEFEHPAAVQRPADPPHRRNDPVALRVRTRGTVENSPAQRVHAHRWEVLPLEQVPAAARPGRARAAHASIEHVRPDIDALNAAADRGMLASYWAEQRPDAPAVISEA